MARWARYLVVVQISMLLLSCGGSDPELSPDVSVVSEPAKFIAPDSPRSFLEATAEVGDATGWGAARYEITIDGLTYSEACEPGFMLERKFHLDPSMSLKEVEALIEEGVSERTLYLRVYYEAGRVWFLNYTEDGEDIQGAINEDGHFRILFGAYPHESYCRWSMFEGNFEEGVVTGTFRSVIHSQAEAPTGSCQVEGKFTGKRMPGFYYPFDDK